MVNFEGKIMGQEQGAYRKMELDMTVVSALHLAVLTRVKEVGLLSSSWMIENGTGTLHYQITSKLSAADYFNRYTLSPKNLKDMMNGILRLVANLNQHFLNPIGLIQEFEHLYVDPYHHQLYLMYDPGWYQDVNDCAMEKTYRLIRYILLEKVKIENGDGMDDFIGLLNGLKSSDHESHREAIEEWLKTDSPEMREQNILEISGAEKPLNSSRIILENVESPLTPVNDPAPLSVKIPIQKPKEGTDKMELSGTVIKRFMMVAAIVMMLLLVGLSLIQKVGLMECGMASLVGIGVSLLLERFRWKKVSRCKITEFDIEGPWEVPDQHRGSSGHSEDPLQTLFFEEGFTLSNEDNDQQLQFSKPGITHLSIEDNRTVMLDAAVRYPTLKAINVGVDDIEIKQGRILIGRCATSSDVILSSNTVGRIHAEVLYGDKSLKVKDFNTLNGTYVNEARVGDGYYDLENMDILRFSCFEFRVVMP